MSQLAERFRDNTAPIQTGKPFSVREVIVAGDLGPCGGVKQAIETTQTILKIVNGRQPVYANRQPVHNNLVSGEFAKRGLIIQPDLDTYVADDILILSAHGTPRSDVEILENKGVKVVNTICQLVTKDVRAAERVIDSGGIVLYLGVVGHPEPRAVTHDLPQDRVIFMDRKTKPEDMQIPTDKPITPISQTTVSAEGSRQKIIKLRELNPAASISDLIGICGATDFRQDALLELLEPGNIQYLIVAGSPESQNTGELTDIGVSKLGLDRTQQIDSIADIDLTVFSGISRIGFTSGASVLDEYSEPILRYFQEMGARLTFLTGKEKDSIFTAPKAQIEAVRAYVAQKYAN